MRKNIFILLIIIGFTFFSNIKFSLADCKSSWGGTCVARGGCDESENNRYATADLCPGANGDFNTTPVFCCAPIPAASSGGATGGSNQSAGCTPSTNAAGTASMVCNLTNPLSKISGSTSVPQVIQIIIKAALGVIGGLTLLMFVWGGFQWLTSAGNEERVKNGSKTMLWAVIGLVLVFTSYFILSTFTKYLSTAVQ